MAELERGAIFAGHRIEGVAGRGGFGVVYRATHLALDHVVALKLISTGRAGDETFRDRFKSESRIAVSIRHPNVVAVHNAGEEDGLLFVTMEFIEGTDLRGLLNREGRLPPERAVAIAHQVSAALDAAHERGLVHRDIKPGNVLIEQRNGAEHVYLTDFGLSKQMDATSGVTASGAFVGTLDYVAPEQIRGDRLDARTDVYALGCVMFELLSGRVPFGQEEKVAKIYAHLQEQPPELIDAAPEVPAPLSEVVWRAMAKDPEARHPSAGDFARAAAAALEGRAPTEPERSVGVGAAAPTQAFDVLAAAVAAADDPETAEAARETPTVVSAPDAAPAPAAGPPTVSGAPRATAQAGARRRRLVAAGVVAVAAAAGAFVLFGGGDESGAPGDGGGGAGRGGAGGGVQPIEVAEAPVGVAAVGGDLWVSSREGRELALVDAAGGRIKASESLDGEGEQVAIDEQGRAWVAIAGESGASSGTVRRYEPDGSFDRDFDVGAEPRGVGVGEEGVWVANLGSDSVSRIDLASGEVQEFPVAPGAAPARVAVGERGVWVSNSGAGTLTKITGEGATVTEIPGAGGEPRGVVVAGGSVWVVDAANDSVLEVDPGSNSVVGEPAPVGEDPRSIAFGFGSLWVTNGTADTVSRIDPQTREVEEIDDVGRSPEGVAPDEENGVVWISGGADGAPGSLTPIRP